MWGGGGVGVGGGVCVCVCSKFFCNTSIKFVFYVLTFEFPLAYKEACFHFCFVLFFSGCPTDDKVNDPGAVYIFDKDISSGDWIKTIVLAPHDGQNNDYFGFTISLDGDHLLVGAPQCFDYTCYGNGKAYFYDRLSGNWAYSRTTVAISGAHDEMLCVFFSFEKKSYLFLKILPAPFFSQRGVHSCTPFCSRFFPSPKKAGRRRNFKTHFCAQNRLVREQLRRQEKEFFVADLLFFNAKFRVFFEPTKTKVVVICQIRRSICITRFVRCEKTQKNATEFV